MKRVVLLLSILLPFIAYSQRFRSCGTGTGSFYGGINMANYQFSGPGLASTLAVRPSFGFSLGNQWGKYFFVDFIDWSVSGYGARFENKYRINTGYLQFSFGRVGTRISLSKTKEHLAIDFGICPIGYGLGFRGRVVDPTGDKSKLNINKDSPYGIYRSDYIIDAQIRISLLKWLAIGVKYNHGFFPVNRDYKQSGIKYYNRGWGIYLMLGKLYSSPCK